MQEIKFYRSPWRALKLILGCSIFVLGGVWGLTKGKMPVWIAWPNICFFGLGYPIGLFQLFDRRPQIVINEIGILDRAIHNEFINWEIIVNAYPIKISGQEFISLVLDEEFKPSKRKGKLYQQGAKLNEVLGAQELNLQVGQLNINANKLTEFILLMRTVNKQERNDFIQKMLTQQEN